MTINDPGPQAYLNLRGVNEGTSLTPYDPTAAARADHEREMAIILAIEPEVTA